MKQIKRPNIILVMLVFVTSLNANIFSTPQKETQYTQNELTSSEYAAMFQTIMQFVMESYVDDVDPEVLFEGAMKGLFNSLEDPHTTYLSQSQILDLNDTTSGEFGGLGIHIQKQVVGLDNDSKSKEPPYVKIISPINGTPAYKAGLKSGDYITHIEDESTVDLTSDDVLDRLRGEPGTKVKITVLRNKSIVIDIEIIREIIKIPTEEHQIIDGIGYIKISQFTNHSPEQFKKVIEEFLQKNVTGLIIDVRNNPGGLLQSVIDISDFFFDDGIIVSTRSRLPQESQEFRAKKGIIFPKEIPVVILTNGGSASASEILTGVFKDRNRGTIIGTKTFGKGSVQQMRLFGDGGFKITVARFFSPSGTTIDKIGIEPHIVIKEKDITDLTEEQTIKYIELITERIINNHILDNGAMSEEEIVLFSKEIIDMGYDLPLEFLQSEIRNSVNRNKENPPVVDLLHDSVLIKAIEVLNIK